MTTSARRFDPRIVACYLYPITRYGYPPPAEGTERYIAELAALGFRSIELEGIHAPHLRAMHRLRHDVRRTLDRFEVAVPYYWPRAARLGDGVELPGRPRPPPRPTHHVPSPDGVDRAAGLRAERR